ncbi:MAG: hypothetical protein J6B91_01015 [Prevotella sp.]|nr:hypothetical protein [Prevotella sp.]
MKIKTLFITALLLVTAMAAQTASGRGRVCIYYEIDCNSPTHLFFSYDVDDMEYNITYGGKT